MNQHLWVREEITPPQQATTTRKMWLVFWVHQIQEMQRFPDRSKQLVEEMGGVLEH